MLLKDTNKKMILTETNIGKKIIVDLGRDDQKKLILDHQATILSSPTLLTESMRGDDGYIYMEGRIQTYGVQNFNGRQYSEQILKREADRYQKIINEKRAWGELDHPDDSVISYDRTCWIMTEIRWEEPHLIGVVKILDTPKGRILKEIMKHGPVGISSRGMGTVTERGGMVHVNEDFQLICFDAVSESSNPGSYMSKIGLQESFRTTGDYLRPGSHLDNIYNSILGDF